MDTRNDRRQAATAIAITVVVATVVTLLLNALFAPDDPFDRIERVEAGLAERSAAFEALGAEIGELRAELAEVQTAVLAAREEAAQAREDALRAREEAATRQQALEEALAAVARQPPRITVLTPEPAEPEVTVEPAEPRIAVEAAEPRVSVVMPEQRAAGAAAGASAIEPGRVELPGAEREAPSPPEVEVLAVPDDEREATAAIAPLQEPQPPSPLAVREAAELIGSDVVNTRGEKIAEITDVVRSPTGGGLYAVLEVGGLISEVVGVLGPKEVAVPVDEFAPGPGDEVILPEASEEELRNLPAYEEALFEPLPR